MLMLHGAMWISALSQLGHSSGIAGHLVLNLIFSADGFIIVQN